VGGVKLGQTVVPIGPTNNFAGNVYATSALTLTNSNLLQSDPTKSLTGGSSSTADKVLIFNPVAGTFTTYFWSTAARLALAGGVRVLPIRAAHRFRWVRVS